MRGAEDKLVVSLDGKATVIITRVGIPASEFIIIDLWTAGSDESASGGCVYQTSVISTVGMLYP